jgi:hypothetical protein
VLISWVLDGFQQFNKKYGQQLPDGTYQVPARWQAGLSNVNSHTKNLREELWVELILDRAPTLEKLLVYSSTVSSQNDSDTDTRS